MDRVHSWAAGEQVASADLNNIQDEAASLYQVAWTWRGRRPTLSCTGANLVVGEHTGVGVGATQAAAVLVAACAETTLNLSGLTPSAWYYLYAYDDAGACGYEWSTTVPDGGLAYKTGDQTRAYVGCFYATGAALALPFRMVGGRYTYRISAVALASLTAYYDATASATYIDLSLATFMPPHSRTARLRVNVAVVTTATWAGRTNGDTTAAWESPFVPANTTLEFLVELETDSAQVIEHKSATDTSETIYVVGFDE